MLSQNPSPSGRLFLPSATGIIPADPRSRIPSACAKGIEAELEKFVAQPQYPCVAAVAALKQKDYQIGLYSNFGAAGTSDELRRDLLFFLERQRTLKAPYLSFFAVFEPGNFSEDDFERSLWNELSHLTSEEDKATDWAPGTATDPADKSFCFSLGGAAFFVVGIHPNSSRKSRQFKYPALIFNVFSQFTDLQIAGKYDAMVKTNRSREVKFEGSVNPMALAHGETWETIQFSGKANDPNWKCPFQFLAKSKELELAS
ncbi:MAG: hypothetical protein EOP11_01165 [Proteobacteria bacterium]|nr:MAG: hypothetical protein EOP11_01165 [Pseudomonadota bacterium]